MIKKHCFIAVFALFFLFSFDSFSQKSNVDFGLQSFLNFQISSLDQINEVLKANNFPEIRNTQTTVGVGFYVDYKRFSLDLGTGFYFPRRSGQTNLYNTLSGYLTQVSISYRFLEKERLCLDALVGGYATVWQADIRKDEKITTFDQVLLFNNNSASFRYLAPALDLGIQLYAKGFPVKIGFGYRMGSKTDWQGNVQSLQNSPSDSPNHFYITLKMRLQALKKKEE